MLTAAQHQLLVVTQRVESLQGDVQEKLNVVKSLRREREGIDAHVEALRNELAQAEAEQQEIHADLQREEDILRAVAHDLAKTQLLQRRFRNTLREGQGFNRSLVWLVSNTEEMGGASLVKLADECTVALPSTRRTFVVDGIAEVAAQGDGTLVSTGSCSDDSDGDADHNNGSSSQTDRVSDQFRSTIRATVEEACRGYNLHFVGLEEGDVSRVRGAHETIPDGRSVLDPGADYDDDSNTFGGESDDLGGAHQPAVLSAETTLFGAVRASRGHGAPPRAASPVGGLCRQFVSTFFDAMESLDVTHFNLRATFAEISPEGVYDLLDVDDGDGIQKYPKGIPLPVGRFPLDAGSNSNHNTPTGRQQHNAHPTDLMVTSLQLCAKEEFEEMLSCALENRTRRLQDRYHAEAGGGGGGGEPPIHQATLAALFGGHLILTLYVETFNSRGNYRRSCVVFAGVAGGASRLGGAAVTPPFGHRQRRHATAPFTPEQEWVARGYNAVLDCVSVAAASSLSVVAGMCRRGGLATVASFEECMLALDGGSGGASSNPAPTIARTLSEVELPHQSSTRVVAAIREVFGGNSRGILCCAIRRLQQQTPLNNGGDNSGDATARQLASTDELLSYAQHFKSTANEAVPYDLPPELQRLTEAMSLSSLRSDSSDAVLSSKGARHANLHSVMNTSTPNVPFHQPTRGLPASSSRQAPVNIQPQPTRETHQGHDHRNGLAVSRTSSIASADRNLPNPTPMTDHQPQRRSNQPPVAPQGRRFVAGMPVSAIGNGGFATPQSSSVNTSLQLDGREQRSEHQHKHLNSSNVGYQHLHSDTKHHPTETPLQQRKDEQEHFDPRSALAVDDVDRRTASSLATNNGSYPPQHQSTRFGVSVATLRNRADKVPPSAQLMGREYPIHGDSLYRI